MNPGQGGARQWLHLFALIVDSREGAILLLVVFEFMEDIDFLISSV